MCFCSSEDELVTSAESITRQESCRKIGNNGFSGWYHLAVFNLASPHNWRWYEHICYGKLRKTVSCLYIDQNHKSKMCLKGINTVWLSVVFDVSRPETHKEEEKNMKKQVFSYTGNDPLKLFIEVTINV